MKVNVDKACSHSELLRLVRHYKHWGYNVEVTVVDDGYSIRYWMGG